MKFFQSIKSLSIGLAVFSGLSFMAIGDATAYDVPMEIESGQSGSLFIDTVDENAWENFEPPRDEKYDWIQLQSGEWLKGEIISLYNFSFEFDSKELGLLNIDWEDVRQIRSARDISIQIEGNEFLDGIFTEIGVLQMLKNEVVVIVHNQVEVYKRNQIISIAKTRDTERDLWSGKIFIGGNVRSGNVDTVDFNMIANTMRRTISSRFSIDYTGNFSRVQSIETSRNHRLVSYFDKFLSREFFWRVYMAEYFQDNFINIADQYSLISSFGYNLIRTSHTEWEVSGGPGVFYKRYVSVEPGEDIDNTSPLLALGTKYDTEITKWMDYLFELRVQFVDNTSGRYNHYMLTSLSIDLVGDLDLDLSLIWNRVARPQPSADGTIPKQDDFQMIVGVSYEY